MKKKPSSPENFILLTGLAQKINAPLRSLLLSSKKLIDTYKSKDFEYVSYKDFRHMLSTLEQMNKQISRCYETTQRMVGLNTHKAGHASCDVNEVIRDIADLFSQQLVSAKIKLHVRLKKDIPLVPINRVEGHQILHNVLTNAIQAMPAGGVIKVRSSLSADAHAVLVEIVDDGVGINEQHLSKIFEPFFTTKDQGVEKSSGLGLSVVNAIVQAVGGSIEVHSSLRKGTRVLITLPVIVV